jgi:hypothetical protein
MNNTRQQIDKRIRELQREEKTYILFEERFLLEGTQVALSRDGNNLRYMGERFTDYGVEPPLVIEMKDSITCSDLEKIFSAVKMLGFKR